MHRFSRRAGLTGATALLFAGCSPTSRDKDDGKIDLWYWNRSIDPGLFREFERQNPGVIVNDQVIGGDYNSKLRTNLAGKAFIPDVVALNDDVSTYFPDADQFADLYDLGAGDVEPEYLPWKWQAGVTNDGKMVGFPMDAGPTALFYRQDLFGQAGLPTEPADVAALMPAWDEYFKAGSQLQQALPAVKLNSESGNQFTQVRRQSADLYVSRDDVYLGGGDVVRNAWDTAIRGYQMGLYGNVATFTPDWNAAMATSSVASFPGAVWMKEILMEAAPDTSGLWRVASLPGGPGNQGGSFMAVTEASNKKDVSFELIRFVQGPAAQLGSYTGLNLYPAAISPLSSPEVNQPEPFFGGQITNDVFGAAALKVPNFYFSPADNVINPIFAVELENVVVLGKDPEQGWQDAQKQVKREVKHKMPWVKWEAD